MKTGAILLDIVNLVVARQKNIILDIPALSIYEGEILALLGPNGAGKSTLLYTLAGLLKPVRGDFYFRGKKIGLASEAFDYRRRVTVVFQDPLLFRGTVFDNVATGLRFRGLSRKEAAPIVERVLDLFGISYLMGRQAKKISGGEAQRTSLARAFATSPELILLDESFSSLDQPSRDSLMDDLHMILKETNTTAILATHERSEALRLANRIAIMNQGRIVQIGPLSEVMNRPQNELVASFVGMETLFNGKVLRCQNGSFVMDVFGCEIEAAGEALPGERVVCSIRPEEISIGEKSLPAPVSGINFVYGRISRITSLGPYVRVALDCGFPLVAYITEHNRERLMLSEGKEAGASFSPLSLHLIRKG